MRADAQRGELILELGRLTGDWSAETIRHLYGALGQPGGREELAELLALLYRIHPESRAQILSNLRQQLSLRIVRQVD